MMNSHYKRKSSLARTTRRGITLIESIVSIAILSVAITGPMALAAHSIKASGAARNELIATHLAEEGLEVMRNMRDNRSAEDGTKRDEGDDDLDGVKNSSEWMQGIFADCSSSGCAIDITAHASSDVWSHESPVDSIVPCQGDCSQQSVVYLNPGTGFYRQSGVPLGAPWISTQFRRTIQLEGIDDPLLPKREVRVTSTVTFPGYGGIRRTLSVSQNIYNWFPYLHF